VLQQCGRGLEPRGQGIAPQILNPLAGQDPRAAHAQQIGGDRPMEQVRHVGEILHRANLDARDPGRTERARERDCISGHQVAGLCCPAPLADRGEQFPEPREGRSDIRLLRQPPRVRPFFPADHQLDQRSGEHPLELLERSREPGSPRTPDRCVRVRLVVRRRWFGFPAMSALYELCSGRPGCCGTACPRRRRHELGSLVLVEHIPGRRASAPSVS